MLVNYKGEPVEFGNLIIKKESTFEGIMKERDRVFSNPDLCSNLSTFAKNETKDYYYSIAVETLIDTAVAKMGVLSEPATRLYLDGLEDEKKLSVNRIIDFLSFESKEQAAENIPNQFWLEDDYFYNSLNLSFYALTILDPKIESRFEVGFILNKNKKCIGNAGYSEKLKMNLPYFLTFFDKKLIIVDPVKGRVETISFKNKIKELYIKENKIWCDDIAFAEKVKGKTEFLIPFDERQRDFRQAEREAKRKAGKKVKETSWRTIGLGSLRGSNKNIKEHILIALMVFGINVCRFTMMEGHSIYTIDHKNGIHDCNKIDNFDLLPRKANNSKGDTEKGFFDWFFYLSGYELDKCS